jgi:excisionase family DNA binding protein
MTGAESISTTEAALRLKLSKATIVRLIHRGDLKAVKKTTGDKRNSPYMVDPDSVESYKANRSA